MAKPSTKKSPIEPLTVSKIYETIQAKSYLHKLWWDLISDIQEKPTYQHLKAMVNDVVHNTLQNFATKPVEANEDLKRRSELTEISIMTYTLDTVISEVLYGRYKKEFENIVKNLIKDLLLKGKKKEATNPDSVFENIERIFDNKNPGSTGKKENNLAVNEAKSQNSNASKDIEKSNAAPARKRGRPKKISVDEEKTKKICAVPKRKGRPPITPEKRIAASFNNRKHEIPNQESDDESKISVGILSIDSVSSVHTSELSSFEDTISICSDDEGEKKHISLKVANEMYLRGKLSQIYQFEKKSERLKRMKEISKDLTKKNNSSSGKVNLSPRKALPQRIRKPNPKYNSETMYCDVKDYSSPHADTGSSSSEDEMDNKPLRPHKVQRKRIRSILDKETGSSLASKLSASKRIKRNNSPLSKTSKKCYTTSDLYKPRPVIGSF